MKKIYRWKGWLAALAAGSIIPSCATDFRDAVTIGWMDAVSGTITDSIMAAFPLADLLAR